MKKLFVLVVLATTAHAAPLYTVTIKLNPPQPDATILFYNNAKNAPKNAACSNVNSKKPLFTCKLPAGNYTLSVYSDEYSFESVRRPSVAISKNTTLIIPLKVKAAKPPLPPEALAPFDDLIIKVTGEIQECGKTIPQPDRRCAVTSLKPELVKRWANLVEGMKQTEPWTRAANLSLSTFEVGGLPYCLILSETQDGGTLIQWARNFTP